MSRTTSTESTRPLIQITNITINMNGAPPTDGLADVFKMCTLIGQQMHNHENLPSTSTNPPSAPRAPEPSEPPAHQTPPPRAPQEVDAVALDPTVWNELVKPQKEKAKKKSEYVNLHTFASTSSSDSSGSAEAKPRRFRLVPSRKLRAVPEEELPKKKFGGEKKRREYVVLGRINSLEPVISEKE